MRCLKRYIARDVYRLLVPLIPIPLYKTQEHPRTRYRPAPCGPYRFSVESAAESRPRETVSVGFMAAGAQNVGHAANTTAETNNVGRLPCPREGSHPAG